MFHLMSSCKTRDMIWPPYRTYGTPDETHHRSKFFRPLQAPLLNNSSRPPKLTATSIVYLSASETFTVIWRGCNSVGRQFFLYWSGEQMYTIHRRPVNAIKSLVLSFLSPFKTYPCVGNTLRFIVSIMAPLQCVVQHSQYGCRNIVPVNVWRFPTPHDL